MTLVLYGPPGAGKTTRLQREMETRMQRDQLAPEEVAFVSFSRNAVGEMVTRMGLDPARTPHWKTIHALGLAALGAGQHRVAEDTSKTRFLAEMGATDSGTEAEVETAWRLGELAEARCVPLAAVYADPGSHAALSLETVQRWWTRWTMWCDEARLLRFGSMLTRATKRRATLLADVRLVVVDEAADTSRAQLRLLQHLIPPQAEVIVAGDDDQAIYEGLGALGLDAMQAWPDPVEEVLDRTYRLPDTLMQAAGRVIRTIPHRRFKPCRPRPGEGQVLHVPHVDDLVLPPTGSVLLLARRVRSLPLLRRLVQDAEQPFRDHDGTWSHEHTIVQAALAWERLQRGRSLETADVQAIRLHLAPEAMPGLRGMARLTRGDLPEGLRGRPWFAVLTQRVSQPRVEYVRAMLRRVDGKLRRLQTEARIRVTTIHDAKGTEADHVILLDHRGPWLDGLCAEHDGVREAETRVRYVGMTRARETLTLLGGDPPT